jgi:hypothetical protein
MTAIRPGGPFAKREPSPDPDFLWTLLALAHFMRLSLTKAAHADFGGAPCRKSGEGWGTGSENAPSAVGAALNPGSHPAAKSPYSSEGRFLKGTASGRT